MPILYNLRFLKSIRFLKIFEKYLAFSIIHLYHLLANTIQLAISKVNTFSKDF
nr:MAG TPA: hypothetical protein [Caudoviricetes sp.]